MSGRVFVTGMGAISPLGLTVGETWGGLCKGQSGIDYISSFDTEKFGVCIAGEVKGFVPEDHIDRKNSRRMDRFAQFAVVAAKEALDQAKLDFDSVDPWKLAVVVGSGIGGIQTLSKQMEVLRENGPRRVTPFLVPMMLGDMASAQVSMMAGALGRNFCPVSSCSSGADAIGMGWEMISRGEADVVIAGGSEAAICSIAIAGFDSARALSRNNHPPHKASRPFDLHRDGFVMGEGAGIVILESADVVIKRGSVPIVEFLGYGTTSDAHHLTEPSPDAKSATKAIKMVLSKSKLRPTDVDYINAHGTSTVLNDRQETLAIKKAFGDFAGKVPVSSTKSMTGHMLGAGGPLEAIIIAKAIRENIIPPTINLDNPDPDCDLDYVPNKARSCNVNVAMSNSFGFGGHNSVIVMGEPTASS